MATARELQKSLEKAIEKKDLKRVRKLLSDKVPLNRTPAGTYPALVVASTSGSAEMIRLLVESGADPRHRCHPFQETALHFATTPAAAAALLDVGADIEAATQEGDRPLHAAVCSNLPPVVSLLLRRGAEPDVRRKLDGCTPLHQAVRELRTKIVQLLLEGGADPDVRDNDGSTPLHLAALMRSKRVLPVTIALLEGGAGVDVADNTGTTPLIVAAMNGELAVLRELVQAGASLDAATRWKETALSHAIYLGRRDVAACLVAAGANPDIRISPKHPDPRRRAKTARELAATSDVRGIRSLLEK